jgi:hypothetical protein
MVLLVALAFAAPLVAQEYLEDPGEEGEEEPGEEGEEDPGEEGEGGEDDPYGFKPIDTTFPFGFAFIPAGTFTMGSPEAEEDRDADEVEHRVTLSRPFFLSATEVAQNEWLELMGTTPSKFDGPVESVSWFDALAFCNARSKREGLEECYDLSSCEGDPGEDYKCKKEPSFRAGCMGYRLPTEAEWEYAARSDVAKTTLSPGPKTEGTFTPTESEPNPWGLYEMGSNVAEWVWDWYGPLELTSVTDPTGAASGTKRVVRGGSWKLTKRADRPAYRNAVAPDGSGDALGFRVARTAKPEDEKLVRRVSVSHAAAGSFTSKGAKERVELRRTALVTVLTPFAPGESNDQTVYREDIVVLDDAGKMLRSFFLATWEERWETGTFWDLAGVLLPCGGELSVLVVTSKAVQGSGCAGSTASFYELGGAELKSVLELEAGDLKVTVHEDGKGFLYQIGQDCVWSELGEPEPWVCKRGKLRAVEP